MEYRQLGSSDVKVSAVTLGTWAIGGWMWGGTDDAGADAAIREAVDRGVTSIDTAPIYGFGHSERVVGRAVRGRRDEVQLLTKFCLRWDRQEGEFYFESRTLDDQPVTVYRNARPERIAEECEASLKRLGTDYIDLYQCHWRDHTTPVEDTMAAMEKLVQAGKIRAAGISNFTVEEIDAGRKVFPLASNQPPYSMVRRDIEADVLPYCRQHGVGVIVYSPLQLGLLTGKMTMDRRFPSTDQRARSPYFQPENRRKALDLVERLRPYAEAHHATVAQLVIHWTIGRPGVAAALVGARNAEQARENAAAADLELTDDERREIDQLVDAVTLDV
jgi:aryl-alcohol dehydrogenase-like predicted oxidoreductase